MRRRPWRCHTSIVPPHAAYQALAAAVLRQAVLDSRDVRLSREARERAAAFLSGGGTLELWADLVQLPPALIRDRAARRIGTWGNPMNDDRLQRVGQAYGQIVDLITSEGPPVERLTTFMMLVGQVSAEYQIREDEIRTEVRAEAWSAGWDAGYARGHATGSLTGFEAGTARGRQDAEREAEPAITGEPVTMAEAEADTAAPGETGGEAPDTESAKGSVH